MGFGILPVLTMVLLPHAAPLAATLLTFAPFALFGIG